MANLSVVWRQFGELWAGWPMHRRLSMVLGLLFGGGAFAALLFWGTQQTYSPLLTNLSETDAAEIAQALDRERVPYQIAAGGTALLVPEERVHELRLRMAGQGLPKGGGVGFEIFDDPGIGTSRFAEKVNFRRALEGELARTVRQLDPVRDARIHLVIAERTLFQAPTEQARASVTVQLHPGRVLAGEQVQAITHLVSSSVQGLSPNEVTVVDGHGAVLAKGGADPRGLAANLEQQQLFERRMEQRVAAILEPTIGAGRVAVRVTADLDRSESERTTETFDPDAVVVRSEQMSEEKRGTLAVNPSGIPGARTNLLGLDAATEEKTAHNGRRTETRNYEISKVTNRETTSLGAVRRLSVAVLVDGVAPAGAVDQAAFVPRPAEELARLTELVKKAVGFDAARGDQVEVQSARFVAPELGGPPPAEMPVWLSMLLKVWKPAVVSLVLLALGFVALRSGRAVSRYGAEILDVPRTVRELEAASISQGLVGGRSAAPDVPFAKPEPRRAAAVVKGWLSQA